MSDLLIFDVLLIRGGIRNPDMLFPPTDWTVLRKLLDAIDESVYDILKKDCLVYILLKWAWDMDSKETNPGWDVRYLQDRCVPPQFAALADAYWLLDTGTHLSVRSISRVAHFLFSNQPLSFVRLQRAVSILSDARLNRDYVSKILQALSLSSSRAAFASGTAAATATLVVKYVRTAKPLLTEPDDIDLYALSLAQLSFMDAWAYQKSFPDESDTRERLLRKIMAWCLMRTCLALSRFPIQSIQLTHEFKPATPKQEPLAQLLAFPLSSYEQSFLHSLALPSSMSGVNTHSAATTSGPVLSSRAISILQDFLCVRAIQSGDYVGAIKLDRQFSSVSPSLGSGASSGIASQTTSSGRDAVDRKSIIQDLFATLPPAERTLLEDEIGKVATGVRANTLATPRQDASARRPLMPEMSLSASWEDIRASTGSPAPSPSLSSSAIGSGLTSKTTPARMLTSPSPFSSRVSRPQPASAYQVPPVPKFTAFGSPIPSTSGMSAGRRVITERGKTLFSTSTNGGPSAAVKPPTHISLFDSAGSAKTAPNAFYKPPSAPIARVSLDVASALASSSTTKSAANTAKQNGRTQRGESDDEDVSMGSRSDVEIIEEAGGEERDEEAGTEEEGDAGEFITYEKSGAGDLTLHQRDVDEVMGEEDRVGADLGFSIFGGSKSATQNGSASGKRSVSGNGRALHASPPHRTRVSPPREEDKSLSMSVNSTTTGRWRAPPGAFHHEEEDDEDRHDQNAHGSKDDSEEGEDEGDNRTQTTPISSPRRRTRTKTQPLTPSRPSARSQPQRTLKNTTTTAGSARRTSSSRPRPTRTIPGALTDEDNDEHGQDDTDMDHAGTLGDEDTETDEQEEDDDAIAPLPSRSSRRTRSSGFFGAPTTASSKSKSSTKPTVPAKAATATGAAAKGKAKARPSEVKTPARRSSRLSTAPSLSPDHTETASPTKKGRKSTGPKPSVAGSGSGGVAVATRNSTRRKR